MDHDAIVQDWQQHAERNDEKNYRFLRSLKVRGYGFDADQLASELHEQAFSLVDCTRCANCCKKMTVRLTRSDIKRIAKHLQMTVDEFTDRYLVEDGEREGLLTLREKPCPFLGSDDRCTIYAVRPACCRGFPYTDKEGFVFSTFMHANNARLCPAVYWIVEQMRRRALGEDVASSHKPTRNAADVVE